MREGLFLLNGVSVTLFGSILCASFCRVLSSGRNRRIFCCYMAAVLLMQGFLASLLETELLRQIYPLTIHFPLMLLLFFLTGKLLWPLVCVLTAYLCCQLRRWLALFMVAAVSGGETMQAAVELIVTLPMLLLLLRFVSPAVCRLLNQSVKTQCQFGVIPALYYLFDYVTVVYTDLLIMGSSAAVEFMPFVCCMSYLVFLLYHSAEETKHTRLQLHQKNLDIQLKQSVREISALRESQSLTRQYRHDLRHHLWYISSCIENGQIEQAQTYIAGICKEIDAQKVEQYCENEAANLILSSFVGRAQKEGIGITVQGILPAAIPVSDSDLCVLLSNALENAIHACRKLHAAGTDCVIDVQFYMRDRKLFLQVTNPCGRDVRLENGVPVSDQPDHGIGVQSICTIVQKYGGVYTFLVQNDRFVLRLSV